MDAASIAELKVLTLLHENTAAAIQYGISKHKTMKDTIKTSDHILALLDFGHSHLTASVYNYTFGTASLGQLELVQMEYDSQLGGIDLDIALAEHFADHFEKQYKLNVRKEPRAMNRLIQQARKTKEILSANAETYAQVESLMDDRDFRLLMSREKLQELAAPLAERIKNVVTKALANVERIDAVELIGGANRVPFVQQIIKQAVGGVNLGFSLNADEAISLGAAFHAASLGSSFRVKKYDIVDRHYGVQFKVGEQTQVFEKIARRVSTNMTIEQDFVVDVSYNTLPPNVKQAQISKYEISNVTETMSAWPKEQGKHKRVTLSLGLNRSGAPTCDAQAVLEETITVRVPKPQKVSNLFESNSHPFFIHFNSSLGLN
jgi:molecular chaperone DnaK (HSP70)